ncbi:MAG: hypothetical protein KDC33_09190 [Thermoleophilia bacterium]|nr:hypothetical protein [Thermoleophilia bacterium]
MASRRLELGFDGGTVLRVTVEESVVSSLTSGLAGDASGWVEVATDDSTCWVRMSQLRYVRVPAEGPKGVGFGDA